MEPDLKNPQAFIALRNYDHFQYVQAGRPRKGSQRQRWTRLHLSLLTSVDWTLADTNTKVVMVTLIVLATQYRNRIPNNRGYLAHVTGLSEAEVDASLTHLYGAGEGGFFSITLDPAPDTEEPTVKRAKPKPKGSSKRFDEFWADYPKKKDRKKALEVWVRNNLDDQADAIIAAVKIAATTRDWKKDDGQFIPYPSTYLNRERWTDSAETEVRSAGQLGVRPDRGW